MYKYRKILSLMMVVMMIFGPSTSSFVYGVDPPAVPQFEYLMESSAIQTSSISYERGGSEINQEDILAGDEINIFIEGDVDGNKIVAFAGNYQVAADVNAMNQVVFTTSQAINVTVNDSVSDDLMMTSIGVVKGNKIFEFYAEGLDHFMLVNGNPDGFVVKAIDSVNGIEYAFFRDLESSPIENGITLDAFTFEAVIHKDIFNAEDPLKIPDIVSIGSNDLYLFKASLISGNTPLEINYEFGTPLDRNGSLSLDGNGITDFISSSDSGVVNLRVFGDFLGGFDVDKDVTLNEGQEQYNNQISYNTTENYFSLTTEVVNGALMNDAGVEINHFLLDGFMLNDFSLQKAKVRMVRMDDVNPIDIPLNSDFTQVQFRASTNPMDQKFFVRVKPLGDVTLLDHTEYRLYMDSPFVQLMLNAMKSNIYTLDGDANNMRGKLEYFEGQQLMNYLEFKNTFTTEGVSSASSPFVKAFVSEPVLQTSDTQAMVSLQTDEHIGEISYRIESSSPIILPLVTMRVGDVEITDVAPLEIIENGIYVYIYSMIVDADYAEAFDLILTPNEDAQMFLQILQNNLYEGLTYVLNHQAFNLTNYIVLNQHNQFDTFDPTFTLMMNEETDQVTVDDANPDQIKVIGRLVADQQGYHTVNFDLMFSDTGLTNKNRLAISGLVTSDGEEDIPFYLTLNQYGNGDFQNSFHMISYDDEHIKGVPVGFDPAAYEVQSDAEFYDQIPLYTAQINHVSLNYTIDSQVYTFEFDYYPASKFDFANSVHFKTMRVSNMSDTIMLEADEFNITTGAALEIFYLDGENEVIAAKFDHVASVNPVEVLDYDGQMRVKKAVQYDILDTQIGFNNISQGLDGVQFMGRIHYSKDFGNDYVLEGNIPVYGNVFVDTAPPQFNVHFEKIETLEAVDYYAFKIHLNDEVYTDELTLDKLTFFNKSNAPITLTGLLLEPEIDSMQGGNSETVNAYMLYIPVDAFVNNIKVVVEPLTDLAGNTSQTQEQFIEIRAEVELIVRNYDYTNLEGNAVWLYPTEFEPKDFDYQWPNGMDFMMVSKDEGYIRGNLPIGEYRIYAFGNEEDKDKSYPLNEIITIEPSANGVPQVEEIILGEANITGHVVRNDPSMLYRESLVFVRSDVYEDYVAVMDEIKITDDYQLMNALQEKLHTMFRAYFSNVQTTLTGEFSVYLNPDYDYKLIGRRLGNIVNELDVPVDVNLTTEIVNLEVTLPQPNLILNVKKANNDAMAYTELELSVGDETFFVETNSEGIIPLLIEDDTEIAVNSLRKFPRKDGEDAVLFIYETPPTFTKTAQMSTYDLIITNTPNVTVYPAMGDEKVLIRENFNIVVNDQYISAFGGVIKLYLENYDSTATYEISQAQLGNSDLIEAPLTIETALVPLDISGQINMMITLQDESQNPLAGRFIHINVNNRYFESKTNENGIAFFIINEDVFGDNEEVNIRYEGYSFNNQWSNFDNLEEMILVSAFTPRYEKGITIIGPNFTGYVLKDDETPLVKDGWLSIEKLTPPSRWFGSYINESGYFEMVINEPGNYVIKQVGDKNGEVEVNFSFTVNENLVVVDKNGTPLELPIIIGKVKPNLSGVLLSQSDQPFAGEHVNLQFKEVKADGTDFVNYALYPWLYERWVDVDEEGYFEANVPDSNYKAIGVGTQTAFIKFASAVPLTLDVENQIKPPFFTFQGRANMYDGSVINRGNVSITNLAETVWKGMDIVGGFFGSNMTEGNQFKIKHINFELGETWYEFNFNKSVTADGNNQNVDITIEPNVMGVLEGIDELANSNWANVRIRPVLTANDLSALDYQKYVLNPWEFDVWSRIIDYNGQQAFFTQLPAGDYVLEEVQLDQNNVRLNIPFTLGETSDGIVTVNNEKYLINVNYSANVTGTITDEGEPVANAWVNVSKFDGLNPTEWFGTKTNEEGQFKFSLKAGTYMLEGYNTEGYFDEGNQWHDGVWTRVGKKFTLESDADTTEIIIAPNLKGTILLPDGSPLNNAWLDIREVLNPGTEDEMINWETGYWFNTPKDSNAFKGSLPNGTFKVTGFGAHNVWFGMDNLGVTFEITEGDVEVIVIQPLEQNFKGKAYFDASGTNVLDWGWIRIRPSNAEFDDWNKKRHLNTEADGSFSASLTDGDYVIEEFGNYRDFRRANISITVLGNTITGLTGTVGNYVIKPPAANVSGIIKDKNGNIYNKKAWITIKPADADEYDWSQAEWVEYRKYGETFKFETSLANGSYKIVSVDSYDFHYRVDSTITVPGSNLNLVVAPPTPNFTGVVHQGTTSASSKISKGWINIARIDADGNQLKLDGTEIPDNEMIDLPYDINWMYTFGTEINSDGEFGMFVESGVTYKIVAVGSYNTWYLSEQTFVGGTNSTNMTITKPGNNVTVTFTNVPSFLAGNNQAWISLYSESGDFRMFHESALVAGTEYAFTSRLKPGTYQIGFIETPTGHFEIEKTFAVTSGDNAITVDFNDYASTVVVSGTLTVNGQAVTNSVSFAVTGVVSGASKKVKITTDSSGQFTVVLPMNTTWSIVEMADINGYRVLTGQNGFSTVETNISNQLINITY